MDLSWISGHWEQLGSIVGVIVWIIRLEGKVLNSEKRLDANEKRITHVEGQVENIESGLTKELSEVKQALARIEGYLKAKSETNGNQEGR